MSPYEVLQTLKKQLSRHTQLPVILAPNTIKPDQPQATLLLTAITIVTGAQAQRDKPLMQLKIKLILTANIEGAGSGLKNALNATWVMTSYLSSQLKLETDTGDSLPNTRLLAQKQSENESFFENPESADKATMEETWILQVQLPNSLVGEP